MMAPCSSPQFIALTACGVRSRGMHLIGTGLGGEASRASVEVLEQRRLAPQTVFGRWAKCRRLADRR
jgi:hypothetical protein